MSNEVDAYDDGDMGNDRSAGVENVIFFIDPPCILYFSIFSNTANGVDELAGNDNVESLRKRNKVLPEKLDLCGGRSGRS
jgi:hypothetical protein